ncbi:MAG TPA: septation protein SepH, partial [Mycobacteriales bacterium]
MRQLRLVGLAEDGASLLLETPTGDAFRLPLDERVRAACRGDLTRLGQIEIEMDNPLRPREIQMRVRAGESAEQIAASSGMPLDRVLRFAYAVLQERGRVVAQARGTAARPKATETLGDLVEDRLVSRGTDASTLEWDAWRREDGRWSVKLAWRHGDRQHAAHWSLDLAKRVLLPDDPAAEQLTAAEYHARTITAVTPLAVAARAVEPGRGPERSRPAELNRIPEATRPAEPGRDRSRPADPGRSQESQADERNRTAAAEPGRHGDEEPRRVVERRPGEPSRRVH